MHILKLRNPLAFFDLETTGINIASDRIVEISVVKALPNGELQTFTQKLNPGIPIPLESSLIHGIYDADVAAMPTFKDYASQLKHQLEGCDLAGFNILKFDVPLLVEEFLRADLDFDTSKRYLLDAQRIYHLMEPRTLSAAYKFYTGNDITSLGGAAHSAEIDTLATYHVLNKQIEKYQGVEIQDNKGNVIIPVVNDVEALHKLTAGRNVDLAGRMVYNQQNQEVFNFGKHKDKVVTEVLAKEPSFYTWIQNGDFTRDTKRKLTEIKLRGANLNK